MRRRSARTQRLRYVLDPRLGGLRQRAQGTAALYDGSALARQGVVVVGARSTYRSVDSLLSPPGAQSAEHPAEPQANFGLMDQIAASSGSHANVRAFGGEPRNVTIFGESAAAAPSTC